MADNAKQLHTRSWCSFQTSLLWVSSKISEGRFIYFLLCLHVQYREFPTMHVAYAVGEIVEHVIPSALARICSAIGEAEFQYTSFVGLLIPWLS